MEKTSVVRNSPQELSLVQEISLADYRPMQAETRDQTWGGGDVGVGLYRPSAAVC